jgi:hypothetical protein
MRIPRAAPRVFDKGTAAVRRQQNRRCHPAVVQFVLLGDPALKIPKRR